MGPPGCLKRHSFTSFPVRPVVCPGRPVSPGLLRLTRAGPAVAILSTRRCLPATQCREAPSSFISSVYPFLPFACRFFSHLFCSGLGLSVSPRAPVGWCLLFVAFLRNNMQTHIEHTTNNYKRSTNNLRSNCDETTRNICKSYAHPTNKLRTTHEQPMKRPRTHYVQSANKQQTNHE